jgi:hypothetical protein
LASCQNHGFQTHSYVNKTWYKREARCIVSRFEKWLKRFTTQYNLNIELGAIHCDEEDYETYADLYRKALRNSAGNPRAIDITPGRKFASAIGMEMGIEENVDSIFYLHLLDDTFADLPYPQIPRSLVKLVDFKRGVNP